MPGTTLVVAGGSPPSSLAVAAVPPFDYCIAADSGADICLSQDWPVDVLVGDMDSVSSTGLAELRASGTQIVEHLPVKDQSDLELALGLAAEGDPWQIVVVGAGGGRLDHFLANVSVIAGGATRSRNVLMLDGSGLVTATASSVDLVGRPGDIVSLLPASGTVEGVTSSGLVYALDDEPLYSGQARGVSNLFVGERASVSVRSGTLLVVQPYVHGVERVQDGPEADL